MSPTTDMLFYFLIFHNQICCALLSHQRRPMDVRKLLSWLAFNFRGCQIIYIKINSVPALRLQ